MLFIVEHIPFFFQSRWTLDISGMCYFSRLGIHWFTNQIKFIFNFKDLDKLRLCTSFQFAIWLSLESHHFAKVIKQCCCKVGILRKFIFPVLQTCFSNVFCVLFIYRQHSGCGWWDFSVRMPLDHLYRRCKLLCCAEWRAVLATREWYEEQLENRKTSKHSNSILAWTPCHVVDVVFDFSKKTHLFEDKNIYFAIWYTWISSLFGTERQTWQTQFTNSSSKRRYKQLIIFTVHP